MIASHALTQYVPLAAQELDNNKVTPGLIGFVIFAAIALSLWALMKNMGKQFKKIDFEEAPDPAAAAPKPSRGLRAHREAQAAARASQDNPAS
ncbi:hypothetical protein G3I60_30655 [Streptomyces sp. SID13666]|uniref:hypothetical protein n=1 Tax=unclassified Streptomyces TaxID=2593676 RepID=UPI001106E7CE|nr:hypothetical protein [Streptomyces fildesensis]NEA58395.1 hypothetical protein [Streptomyces sp. SID13666]NEA73635.1 hypothetical protein [Streptomyces sp. SID13588]QNA75018.1 hypothetical protein C8250_026780 [Streptomyces sp. So13.3]